MKNIRKCLPIPMWLLPGGMDDVIEPKDTRIMLIRCMESLEAKRDSISRKGTETFPYN